MIGSCYSVALRLKTIHQLLGGVRVIEIALMNRQGVGSVRNVCYIGVYGAKNVMNILRVSGFRSSGSLSLQHNPGKVKEILFARMCAGFGSQFIE